MGCDEFASPAELARTQILAIRADPPTVGPGQDSELTILVADADGVVAAPSVRWEIAQTAPDAPPLGTIAAPEGGPVVYTAPAAPPQIPAVGTVSATVMAPDGVLVALKAMLIGDLGTVNPEIATLTVDGEEVAAGASITLVAGVAASLAITTEPPLDEDASFAWYSTAGEIERFQSNPTELVAGAPGEGIAIAVVRDGRGGVAWRELTMRVQ